MAISTARYNGVAQTLHWITAAILVVSVPLGLFHESLEATYGNVMPLHKSLGLTVLLLTLVRLGWRLMRPPPPEPPELPRWQAVLARSTHWAFYVLLIAMPIAGYVMSSAGSRPLALFGLPIPKLALDRDAPIAGFAHEAHEIGGLITAGLILLHVSAALYHQFAGPESVFARMLPGRAAP